MGYQQNMEQFILIRFKGLGLTKEEQHPSLEDKVIEASKILLEECYQQEESRGYNTMEHNIGDS
ncbi:uncharacterized protein G2W53_018664 [Senna tora]|uniref:Uncharacterized protein n=1 Tax=Senna tora TaxID=362788 RepID=A0A834TW85_9FABA|nr:uncharacterized protein G2W53_018664 [Senna tora]